MSSNFECNFYPLIATTPSRHFVDKNSVSGNHYTEQGGNSYKLIILDLLEALYLISVDKSLAQRQLHGYRRRSISFQMYGNESARHRRVARKEKRLAFFEGSGETVANWIRSQVGSVIANANNDRPRYTITCNQKTCSACEIDVRILYES